MKVKEIIKREFDLRCDAMVLAVVMEKGINECKEIKADEYKGNAMMTDDFVQSLMRAAKRVANECDLFDDIIPYIVERFGGKITFGDLKEMIVDEVDVQLVDWNGNEIARYDGKNNISMECDEYEVKGIYTKSKLEIEVW